MRMFAQRNVAVDTANMLCPKDEIESAAAEEHVTRERQPEYHSRAGFFDIFK